MQHSHSHNIPLPTRVIINTYPIPVCPLGRAVHAKCCTAEPEDIYKCVFRLCTPIMYYVYRKWGLIWKQHQDTYDACDKKVQKLPNFNLTKMCLYFTDIFTNQLRVTDFQTSSISWGFRLRDTVLHSPVLSISGLLFSSNGGYILKRKKRLTIYFTK